MHGDPHSVTADDIDALRQLGVTDSELVETIETVSTGNGFNLLSDALQLGAEPFLTYDT